MQKIMVDNYRPRVKNPVLDLIMDILETKELLDHIAEKGNFTKPIEAYSPVYRELKSLLW